MRRLRRAEELIILRIERLLAAAPPSGLITLRCTPDCSTTTHLKQLMRRAAAKANVKIRMHDIMDPPGVRVLICEREKDHGCDSNGI